MQFGKLSLAIILALGLFVPIQSVTAAEAPSKINTGDLDDTFWAVAERANTVDDYQVYLENFPKGKYVPFAKSRIKRMQAASQAVTRQVVAISTGVEPAMVNISGKDFEIGKYEVTQKEWRDIMGGSPSYFKDCGDNCPVEQVSWSDIKKYIDKLNQRSGKEYRLPTEEEWLYACRGGVAGEFCGGGEIAVLGWYEGNSGGSTHPVGQKQVNGYGLYDMSGNVSEWLADEWTADSSSTTGMALMGSIGRRVFQGGAYDGKPGEIRVIDSRRSAVQAMHDRHLGFRLARTLP